MPTEIQLAPTPLHVACLCAAWCGTCRDYRAVLDQMVQEFPSIHFRWVDVEDEADLVDPVEVDDFPTLLIATAQGPRFFGPLTPHLETVRRLIQNHQQPGAQTAASMPIEVAQLAQRIFQLPMTG